MFELLVLAAESFIMIKGVNKDHIERNTLFIMFNEMCGVTYSKGRVKENMFERVIRATNVSLNASVSPVVEDRRVRWTAYSNLHAWFVSFKAFLIEFGFITIGSNGRLVISEAMLRRIANVDETEVLLDGSRTNAGGRPAFSFHGPHFPLTQRPAAKSSLSCTGIFGSNAAGECVPIHWQLPTAATTKDHEKLRFDFLHHVSSTRDRFGCKEEKVWPCTIGLNEKGSMNDEEFDKNIDNSIVPLYPELEDTEGKRVLLKVDSSTGRNGSYLLNKARFRGVYLFHGLPNTTSVQRETDMNYGSFKSVVRSNLKNIATACFSAQKSMKLGPSTFGLIVYGGVCPISKVVCENAVDRRAFNVKSNQHSWAKVGAVPFTMKCLKNKKVRHNRTDRDDPNFNAFVDDQLQNDYSTNQLTMMGYKGEMLRAQYHEDKVRALRAAVPVTVAHTRERQEALIAATTHEKKFFMTGGEHITPDDMFKSAEIVRRNAEAVEVEMDKKRRLEYRARLEAALPVLDRLANVLENAVTRLTGKELEVLLRWKGVPVLKMGNVANRRVLYQQFTYGGEEEEDDASIPAPWTDADEAGLVALRNAPVEMADTLYGRFLATQKRDTERAYQHMDAEERGAFLRKLTEIDADDAKDGQSPPSNPTPV
jgi:hypothetical protein